MLFEGISSLNFLRYTLNSSNCVLACERVSQSSSACNACIVGRQEKENERDEEKPLHPMFLLLCQRTFELFPTLWKILLITTSEVERYEPNIKMKREKNAAIEKLRRFDINWETRDRGKMIKEEKFLMFGVNVEWKPKQQPPTLSISSIIPRG